MPIEILSKLPKEAKDLWEEIYVLSRKKYDEKTSAKIAWFAVKQKYVKKENKWVTKSLEFGKTSTQTKLLKTKSKNEDYLVVEYILTTNTLDEENMRFDDFAIKLFEKQINEKGVIGWFDDNHHIIKSIVNIISEEDELDKVLSSLDTGIKAFHSKYKDGKLFTNIMLKKEYEPLLDIYNGVSVEVIVPKHSIIGNTYKQGKLLGFSFTRNPANKEAVRVN